MTSSSLPCARPPARCCGSGATRRKHTSTFSFFAPSFPCAMPLLGGRKEPPYNGERFLTSKSWQSYIWDRWLMIAVLVAQVQAMLDGRTGHGVLAHRRLGRRRHLVADAAEAPQHARLGAQERAQAAADQGPHRALQKRRAPQQEDVHQGLHPALGPRHRRA